MSRRYSGRDDGGAGPLLFVVFFLAIRNNVWNPAREDSCTQGSEFGLTCGNYIEDSDVWCLQTSLPVVRG